MNPITTANKLKTLRTLKGLSPEQVAEKARLNIDDYRALETGKTAVNSEKLEKACNALGVDAKEWFEDDKSNVFINSGEVSFKENSQQQLNCENCYFYDRNKEDMDMIADITLALKEVVKKLDTEWIWRGMEKYLKKQGLEPGNKGKE